VGLASLAGEVEDVGDVAPTGVIADDVEDFGTRGGGLLGGVTATMEVEEEAAEAVAEGKYPAGFGGSVGAGDCGEVACCSGWRKGTKGLVDKLPGMLASVFGGCLLAKEVGGRSHLAFLVFSSSSPFLLPARSPSRMRLRMTLEGSLSRGTAQGVRHSGQTRATSEDAS